MVFVTVVPVFGFGVVVFGCVLVGLLVFVLFWFWMLVDSLGF